MKTYAFILLCSAVVLTQGQIQGDVKMEIPGNPPPLAVGHGVQLDQVATDMKVQDGSQQTATAQGTPNQNAAAQETPNQNAAAQGTPNQNAAAQGTPNQNAAAQGTPNQNAAAQGTPNQNGAAQETLDALRSDVEKAKGQVHAGVAVAKEISGNPAGLDLHANPKLWPWLNTNKDGNSQIGLSGTHTSDGPNTHDASKALDANNKFQLVKEATDIKAKDARQWSAIVGTRQNAAALESLDAFRTDSEKSKGQVQADVKKEIGKAPVMDPNASSGSHTGEIGGASRHDTSAALETNQKVQSQATVNANPAGRMFEAADSLRKNTAALAQGTFGILRSGYENAKSSVFGQQWI